jgi:hypothetical protein
LYKFFQLEKNNGRGIIPYIFMQQSPCTDKTTSELSKVVSAYEQTVGSTKIDLNLKVNSVGKIKEYFTKDSLEVTIQYEHRANC